MTPKEVAKARRIIRKPWYNRYRMLKMHYVYTVLDKALIKCSIKDTPIYFQEMERYTKKEAYYEKKLNNGQKNKEEDLGRD